MPGWPGPSPVRCLTSFRSNSEKTSGPSSRSSRVRDHGDGVQPFSRLVARGGDDQFGELLAERERVEMWGVSP